MTESDLTPPHLLKINIRNGGATFGAFDGDKMVGFVITLPARSNHELWSHIAGVLEGYRGQGIGQGLKLAQRDWALEQGCRVINWTFDPMRRQNAHFNINLLGTTSHVLHENIYGDMEDALNAGMKSDRIEAHWQITKSSSAGKEIVDSGKLPFILSREAAMKGYLGDLSTWDAAGYRVEIPYHLDDLKRGDLQAAIRWQAALRTTLRSAFENQFHISGLEAAEDRCWYILTRREL